jgi:hypothetical protein
MDANFFALHEISRHAIHSTETLTVASQSMEALGNRQHEVFESLMSSSKLNGAYCSEAEQHTQFHAQLLRNFRLRSQANQERLQNEIVLVCLHFPGMKKNTVLADRKRPTMS